MMRVPKSINQDDLLVFLREKLSFLCNNIDLRECYYSQAMVSSECKNLKRHIDFQKGLYWDMLKGALQHSRLEPLNHLSDILMDASIKAVLPYLFNDTKLGPSVSFEIRDFAYGCL